VHNLSSKLILLDTNILSTFAKIDHMALLLVTIKKKKICIKKKEISIISMNDKETMWSMELPSSLSIFVKENI